MNTDGWKFQMGDPVHKTKGSEWVGDICGFYTTDLSEHGYCIKSIHHKNSVQNYPESALESGYN